MKRAGKQVALSKALKTVSKVRELLISRMFMNMHKWQTNVHCSMSISVPKALGQLDWGDNPLYISLASSKTR